MEDSSMQSIGYLGNLERVSQDKCARTLITCYGYVMKKLLVVATLLACAPSFGDSISIQSLIEHLDRKGFSEAKEYVGKIMSNNRILISDKPVGGSVDIRNWSVDLEDEKLIIISTGLDLYVNGYYKFEDVVNGYAFSECPDSGLSGGVKYFTLDTGITIFWTFAFGTSASIQTLAFDSNKYQSTEAKCKSGWDVWGHH